MSEDHRTSHFISRWTAGQNQVALSSGEAELYAANRGGCEGLGLQTLAKDLGLTGTVNLYLDASATKAIIERRGLGKLRHVEVRDLWMQEALRNKKFKLKKIATDANPSDLGTKPLMEGVIQKHMRTLGFYEPVTETPS